MIVLRPTETRFVEIRHEGWGLDWAIQFPEGIFSQRGCSMTWEAIRPDWRPCGDNAWGYAWRTTDEYVRGVCSRHAEGFVVGLALQAEIAGGDEEVRLSLTLTNESTEPFEDVRCDGGCLQARSDAFRDADEVARSHVLTGGRMVSAAGLDRSIPIRSCYRAASDVHLSGEAEDFWGRSDARVDEPVLVGAVSRDAGWALVLGYEHATRGLQNADEHHHCLHSCPCFGTLAPGQSVTRRGFILFGEDIQTLADALRERLRAAGA